VGIHLTFLVSALAIAAADRITPPIGQVHEQKHG